MLKDASSIGILLLLAALLLTVLEKTGAVRGQAAKDVLKTAGLCAGFALLYDAAARLMFLLLYESTGTPGLRDVFSAKWLERHYTALETGRGLIDLPGHLIGELLFGEYVLGGVVFSMMLTAVGTHLVYLRLRAGYGERAARTAQTLMLVFPGAFFCFLPGAGAYILFTAAAVFFFAGKRLKMPAPGIGPAKVEALFAVLAVLSALLLMATVTRAAG